MLIKKIISHVLRYELPEPLGYSQQYYTQRTAHLIELRTDSGLVGWGECFGPGNVALANKTIVEQVIQPIIVGMNALDRQVIWHKVYNLLRDHGQKGMALQALSGVDIALWDIAGKVANMPLYQLLGGAHRQSIAVYGYGMMLQPKAVSELAAQFADEAVRIRSSGFVAAKMKVGLGVQADIQLATSVRKALGDDYRYMVDANHCYTTSEAFYVGRALQELAVYWFEEPVAPEDHLSYRELRQGLDINIAGGEAEFSCWGWQGLLNSRGLDIAQPEVCALGGISEYLRVLALCHAQFTPVVNHVWGSAISVAVNMHLLAAMPSIPGSMYPWEPMLEFDTTDNKFRDQLLNDPLDIPKQVHESGGRVQLPTGTGIGVEPDLAFLRHYQWGGE